MTIVKYSKRSFSVFFFKRWSAILGRAPPDYQACRVRGDLAGIPASARWLHAQPVLQVLQVHLVDQAHPVLLVFPVLKLLQVPKAPQDPKVPKAPLVPKVHLDRMVLLDQTAYPENLAHLDQKVPLALQANL